MLNRLFYIILNLSITGSITALVFLLLHLIFKNKINKSIFNGLWLLLFISLLIPISIMSPITIFNNSNFKLSETPTLITAKDFLKNTIIPTDSKVIQQSQLAPESNEPSLGDVTPPIAISKMQGAGNILVYIWAFVTFLLFIYGIIIYIHSFLKTKHAKKLSCPAFENNKVLLHTSKSIRLYESDELYSPFVFGVFHPKIILPCNMDQSSDMLTHILIHELFHVKRMDNLKKLFATAVLFIHWFNPVVWLCYSIMQRDIELSCDEKVISLLGSDKNINYATSLYEFARFGQKKIVTGFVSFGEIGAKNRIKNILNYKKSSLSLSILIFVLGFGIVACNVNSPLTSEVTNTLQGSRIVYAAKDGLYGLNLDQTEPTLLVAGENIRGPLFSSASNAVAFQQDENLYAYDFNSTEVHLLMPNVLTFCKGSANTFLASSIEEGIVLLKPSGMEKTVLVEPENSTHYKKRYFALMLSPDDKLLAYKTDILDDSYAYGGGVWLYNMSSSENQLIVEGTRSTDNKTGEDPEPGKWSKDSQNLFVWLKLASASTTADGVLYGLYNVASNKLIKEDDYALAYNENIVFLENGSIMLLSGYDRMMYQNKQLKLFDTTQSPMLQPIVTPDLIPGMLAPSKSGEKIYFTASTPISSDIIDPFPIQRQLYLYESGNILPLTNGENYLNEYPLLLNNEAFLILGRSDTPDEKALWLMNTNNKEMHKIASWNYMNSSAERYNGYYGRSDWSGMFDLYDQIK